MRDPPVPALPSDDLSRQASGLHPAYSKMSLRFSSNSVRSISPFASRSFRISMAREAVSPVSRASPTRSSTEAAHQHVKSSDRPQRLYSLPKQSQMQAHWATRSQIDIYDPGYRRRRSQQSSLALGRCTHHSGPLHSAKRDCQRSPPGSPGYATQWPIWPARQSEFSLRGHRRQPPQRFSPATISG
jgi:hypothetical protein